MRYFDFLKEIREISVAHKLVNEYGEGDIYEYLNSGEHKYPCVFLTVTNLSTTNSGTAINFTLFYTDRLTENQSNKTAIQSTGIDVIKQLLSKFESKHPEFEIVNVNYNPFTEKFSDICAGVFVNVELDNGVDNLENYNECEEGDFELKTITLTANGIYDVIGYDKAVVAVPSIVLNDITITENGVYKADEGGYGEVVVDVPGVLKKVKLNKIEVENNCIVNGTWSGFDVLDKTTLTSLNNMFSECSNLISLDADGWVTKNVKNISFMFSGCVNLKSLNLSNWDTGSNTILWNTFQNCQSLENLDVSGWDTGNVTNMLRTFYGCQSLESLDLTNWNVSKVTDMSYMFSGCEFLQRVGDLSGWNTGNVTNMENMFYDCGWSLYIYGADGVRKSQNLDLSNWNVSNVTNMEEMFQGTVFETLNLSGWDTSKVTKMYKMFYNCMTKVIDITNWTDVSNVTDFGGFARGSLIENCVGGKTVEEVIENNITVLNGLKVSSILPFFDSHIDRASLRALINGLADVTGQSTKTLSVYDKDKLTDEDIAIATAKNWTIS